MQGAQLKLFLDNATTSPIFRNEIRHGFMGSKVGRKHLTSEDARPVKGMASQLKMRNFLKSICTGTDLHPVSTILGLHIRCGWGLNRFYKKLS